MLLTTKTPRGRSMRRTQAAISALAYEAVKTTSIENQIEETIGEERHRTHIAVVKVPDYVLLCEPLTGPVDGYVGYVDTVDFKASFCHQIG